MLGDHHGRTVHANALDRRLPIEVASAMQASQLRLANTHQCRTASQYLCTAVGTMSVACQTWLRRSWWDRHSTDGSRTVRACNLASDTHCACIWRSRSARLNSMRTRKCPSSSAYGAFVAVRHLGAGIATAFGRSKPPLRAQWNYAVRRPTGPRTAVQCIGLQLLYLRDDCPCRRRYRLPPNSN